MNVNPPRIRVVRPNGTVVPRIEYMTFPGGEPHVKLPEWDSATTPFVTIDARPTNMEAFMQTILLVDAIRRETDTEVTGLLMPYFPGARQDRGGPLTVKVYADMVNALELPEVTIVDPHSDVVTALIDNVKVVTPKFYNKTNTYAGIIIPDQGAVKRCSEVAASMELPTYQVLKQRDPRTGALSGFEFTGDLEDVYGHNLLIVDDICDGGGTFLGIADLFPDSTLSLAVSHGIFSKGTAGLLRKFNKLYSTDSFLSVPHLESMGVQALQLT